MWRRRDRQGYRALRSDLRIATRLQNHDAAGAFVQVFRLAVILKKSLWHVGLRREGREGGANGHRFAVLLQAPAAGLLMGTGLTC